MPYHEPLVRRQRGILVLRCEISTENHHRKKIHYLELWQGHLLPFVRQSEAEIRVCVNGPFRLLLVAPMPFNPILVKEIGRVTILFDARHHLIPFELDRTSLDLSRAGGCRCRVVQLSRRGQNSSVQSVDIAVVELAVGAVVGLMGKVP